MKKEIKAIGIKWETDGNNVDLPDEVKLPNYIIENEYDIADYLSSQYGWLVESYSLNTE
jgi:hypothetical protein